MRSENANKSIWQRLLCALMCLLLVCTTVLLAACNNTEETNENENSSDTGNAEEGTDKAPAYEYELNENGMVNVLVFAKDAPKGTKVTSKVLETIELPVDNLPRNVVSNIAEVRGMYTTRNFYKGDYVIENRLSDKVPISVNTDVIQQEITKTDSDYIVVTDYVKANTGEDLYGSLQMLINKNPGRTLYFPDGEYVISHSLETIAKPAESTSFYFSSGAVLKAAEKFKTDGGLCALICLGSIDKENNIRAPGSNFYVMGGVFDCGGRADGISIDGGRETLIKDVVIVNSRYGIHIKEGTNNNSSDSDIDDVTIIGNGMANSVGIYTVGLDNTISNARISNVGRGMTISAGVFVANCSVENTAKIKNAVAYNAGGNDAWFSNCVSIDFDTAFQLGGTRGFYKQCTAIWTDSSFGSKHVMFDTVGSSLRSAIIGCKADFTEGEIPTAFLTANEGGPGRVVAPIYDETLVTDIDATGKYLESGTNVIVSAPAAKKED